MTMEAFTVEHHPHEGGYTLVDIPLGAFSGWVAGRDGGSSRRYILPDMLVCEEAVEELVEALEAGRGIQSLLSSTAALDDVWEQACARHDAEVALAINHPELPHDAWRTDTTVLGPVECDAWEGVLRTEHGRCRFHMVGGPEDLRVSIRNALRNMTGQRLAALSRRNAFTGPEMTSIASWVLHSMRPYAAARYTEWICRALSEGYPYGPLVLGQGDVAGPCDRAELRFHRDRLTCTVDIGDRRFCEEVLTTPSVTTSQMEERHGRAATDVCDHPALAGRSITGAGYTDQRVMHGLDRRDALPLLIHLDPVAFAPGEAEALISDALASFTDVTAGARLAISRMEISERVSRLSAIAGRRVSEITYQGLHSHDLRLTTDGRRLDCDGPIAPGVKWNKGALRVDGLPEAARLALLRTGRGRPLRDVIAMPGMEEARITSVSPAYGRKAAYGQLVVRAA